MTAPTTPAVAGFDEARAADGSLRPGWAELVGDLERLGPAGLATARARVEQQLVGDGVTWSPVLTGTPAPDDEVAQAQRWHLDPVPVLLDAAEFAELERGVAQRSALLDAVLADVYGPQQLLRRGLLPPELVLGHEGYLRATHGIALPGPHQLVVHAVDVARGPDGRFVALADRTQAPSGVGYALADRAVLSRVLPDLVRRHAPRRLGAFADTLRTALLAAAPDSVEQPRVVVLSPGSHSETAFDQAHLAALLGLPLLEGADLTVHQGRLWMRSLGRLEQVDVVLRRVDAAFCDPLDLRPDSRLGVVGLVEACRRGTVSVVNPLGSGVLENPGLLSLLPQLCRALRDEPLLLPSAPLTWCGTTTGLSHVLAHLDELVLRPVGEGAAVVPSRLDAAGRAELRARLRSEGWRWVGEESVPVSVAPSATSTGAGPRGVVARLFSVGHGGGHVVMPGGLGGVLAAEQGPVWQERPLSAAKDVWVRSTTAEQAVSRPAQVVVVPAPRSVRPAPSSPRLLSDLYWYGRYTERTEFLTRAVAATSTRSVDVRPGTGRAAAEATAVLVGAVGALSGWWRDPDPEHLAEPVAALRTVTADAGRPGGIGHSLGRAVQAATAVRDQVSADTWGVLAGAERALERLRAAPADDEPALRTAHGELLVATLALAGLAAESTVRDPGWHLLDTGRRVERAQLLTTLLAAALGAPCRTRTAEVLLLESVLQATESVLTYRRRYSGELDVTAVLTLLLLDPTNPRALVFQLQAVAGDLRALPGATGTSRPDRLLEELLATVRRLEPAGLLAVDETGRRAGLTAVLTSLGTALRAVADAVTTQHLSLTALLTQPAEYGPDGGGW